MTWLLPSVLLGACGTLLGLEPPSRDQDPEGGAAGAAALGGIAGTFGAGGDRGGAPSGEAGLGGESAGGAFAGAGRGGGAAEGGTGDAAAGAGGAGAGGVGASGAGGADGSEAGAGGEAEAGAGGQASATGPVIGGACDREEEFACHATNPYISLACRDGSWTLRATCRGDQLCDGADGECSLIAYPCDAPVSRCEGRWTLFDCGADATDPKAIRCPFGCEEGRCLPASGDELVVHYPDVLTQWSPATPWSLPITVCFRSEAENKALAGVIRDEAERSWGRVLNVEFSGWSACGEPAASPRVEIEFFEDCRSRLGSDVPLGGKSADAQVARVGICRSYRDSADVLQDIAQHEALLRFVTRHQLGHVFGWEDDDALSPEPTAMAPSLREADAESLVLTSALLRRYRFNTPYAHKPSNTLVTTHGACLSPEGNGLTLRACSAAGSGRFDLYGDQVNSVLPAAPGCITATLEDSVPRLEACESASSSSRFSMLRTRWSTPDRCVMPERAVAGSPVVTAPCEPVGAPSQAWYFEIFGQTERGSTVARLHFGATGHCLAIAEGTANSFDVPLLEACDDTLQARHLFQLWSDGEISIGSDPPGGANVLCLQWDHPQSVLYFGSCTLDEYWFSGALETPTGLVLTQVVDQGATELRAMSLGAGELPADNQIFDYVF